MASSLRSQRRLATYFALFLLSICLQITCSTASPLVMEERDIKQRDAQLERRTYFPAYPPSCQICEQNYGQIVNCANASVVLANFAQIIASPVQFLDVIVCACTNTFQAAYPQCVDCFEQTNQTAFLEPPNGNLSSVITGMQQICALGSSIFGHVASRNSELPGQTPITVASAGAAFRRAGVSLLGINGDAMGALFVGVATVIIGFGMGVWTVL